MSSKRWSGSAGDGLSQPGTCEGWWMDGKTGERGTWGYPSQPSTDRRDATART